MIDAWSTSEVYAAEAALMAEVGDGELMARAVKGLIEVTRARIEQLGARRVVALVGPGNNGADALYAVAGLAAMGVTCAAVHVAGKVHRGALAAARASGVVLVAVADGAESAERAEAGALGTEATAAIAEADVVLDGILGIGGHGGLPPWAQRWVDGVPDTAYVMAVDLPSGQSPNGGALDADGVFADETVTFSVLKPVHLLPPTEVACGQVTVVDIGLVMTTPPTVRRLTRDDVAARWPVPTSRDDKYSRGVVGIIAGGEGYSGAAVLAVTAAVEAGAGMVRYLGPPAPTGLVRAAVPEAVHGTGQVQAWVIGPGLDVADQDSAEQVRLAHDALASDRPVVLDAGGLDLIAAGWTRTAPTLLTPHAGEAARLLTRLDPTAAPIADPSLECVKAGPQTTPLSRTEAEGAGGERAQAEVQEKVTRAAVEADPVGAARRLADLTRCAVLLKGATTVIAAPDGRLATQHDAPAWLATAGAGDVLAGLLGTLVAAGLEAFDAAALGALVHGVAADRANPGGPVRALAVAQALPTTIAALLRRP